jgi:ectoine hydroxylase-related dioxygenase (phytanoyl-CoA dioxygenase family)
VTSDEADAFHRDGAVLIKNVLDADWVARALAGLDAAIAEPDALSGVLDRELRVDQFPAARSADLRALVDESPIAEIVGSAMRGPVRFYMDQLFYKPAGFIPPTPWHQDTSYYNIDGHDVIRAWVSPDHVARDASLEVVRGSHLWNVTYSPLAGRDPDLDDNARAMIEGADPDQPMLGVEAHDRWHYFSGVRDKSLPWVPDIEGHRDSYEILGWDFEPGDVLLFHGNILHSARGDVTVPHPRRSHASLWAGPDVVYRHRLGQVIPDPVALYASNPKTGQPLTDFPEVFPLAWAPEDAEAR